MNGTTSAAAGGVILRRTIFTVAVLLLLAPAVAMQFTSEVNWDVRDFIAAAVLLGATLLAIELTMRFIGSRRYRIAAIAAVILALGLVWVNAAVGLF